MKILLVDKCPLVREGVIHVLRRIDPHAEITEADNYVQVQQHGEQQQDIQLLLLGLALPRQRGLQALKDVRAHLPNAVVIALAEFERCDDIRDTLDNGANAYIAKSCNSDTMFNAMKLVLSGGVYLSPLFAWRQHGAGHDATATQRRHGDRPATLHRPAVRLTKRQLDVLRLLTQGMTNKRIGRELTISDKTVKAHVTMILRVLDASNRTEAGALAAMLGLTPVSADMTTQPRWSEWPSVFSTGQ